MLKELALPYGKTAITLVCDEDHITAALTLLSYDTEFVTAKHAASLAGLCIDL